VISTFGGVATVAKVARALGIAEAVEPYLTEQALRFERDAVASLFAGALAKLSSAEAICLIEPTGAWVVAVRSLPEALADPAVQASGSVQSIESDYGGRYRVVVEPLKMGATPLVAQRPAPAPGEHTLGVLAELGLGTGEIEALVASGAAFTASAAR